MRVVGAIAKATANASCIAASAGSAQGVLSPLLVQPLTVLECSSARTGQVLGASVFFR
jgi:hypothetical protein